MRTDLLRCGAAVAIAGLWVLAFGEALAADPAAPKNDLRYDGKPFPYWRDYLRTELKAERRLEAIRAVAAFGVKGHVREAASAIVEVAKDYMNDSSQAATEEMTLDEKVIEAAVEAIWKMGPAAFDVLLQNVAEPNIRKFAVNVFGGNSPFKKPIPLSRSALKMLIRAVQGDDAEIRQFGVNALGKAMDADERFKKSAVAAVLGGNNSEKFIGALIKTLEEDQSFCVELILGALGQRAKPAIPALVRAHFHQQYSLAKATLQSIGAGPQTLIPAITKELKDREASVRVMAAEWLGELGSQANDAIPALLPGLNDTDEKVRLAVVGALGMIGTQPQKTVPPLARIFSDEKEPPNYRLAVAAALAKLGARARGGVPAFLKVLSDEAEDPPLRSAAIEALAQVGADPRKVVPRLIIVIDREMESSPKANWIADELTARAVAYLVERGPESRKAIPVFIQILKHYTHEEKYRPAVARALGEMGPAAREALPVLRECLKVSDPKLRGAATGAIAKIAGKGG